MNWQSNRVLVFRSHAFFVNASKHTCLNVWNQSAKEGSSYKQVFIHFPNYRNYSFKLILTLHLQLTNVPGLNWVTLECTNSITHAACQSRKTSTSHLPFRPRTLDQKYFFLVRFWLSKTRKRIRTASSNFQNCDRRGQCKIKMQTQSDAKQKTRKISKTKSVISLTDKYVQELEKQEKTKN